MAKTLRVRTRDGWVTKPTADTSYNRLTAEEVDDNFLAIEDEVISITSGLSDTIATSTKTSNYMLAPTDINKIIRMNMAGANTITVPFSGFPDGFTVSVVQVGDGVTTILPENGVTINSPGTLDVAGKYHCVQLVHIGGAVWDLMGSVSETVVDYVGPTGAIATFAGGVAPSGWLKANGALVSRTTYVNLFNTIGTLYGAGNGSTTFALPDLRGEFVRGWDDGRGVDSGRTKGSSQTDDIEAHSHIVYGVGPGVTYSVNGARMLSTPSDHTVTFDSAVTGGTETRPRNVALLYCIKY